MQAVPSLQTQASRGNCSRWPPVTAADCWVHEKQQNASRWHLLADAASGLRSLEEQRMRLVALQASMPAEQGAALQPVVAELTDTLAQQSRRLAALQAEGIPNGRGSEPYALHSPRNTAPEVTQTIPHDIKLLVEKLQKEVARLSLAAIGIVGAVDLAFKNDAALQDAEDFAAYTAKAPDEQTLGTGSWRANRLLSPRPTRSYVVAAATDSAAGAWPMQKGMTQSPSTHGSMPSIAKEQSHAKTTGENRPVKALNGPARQSSQSPRPSPIVAAMSSSPSSPGYMQQSCTCTLTQTIDNTSLWNSQRSRLEMAGSPGAANQLLTSSVMSATRNDFRNLSAEVSNWTVSTPRQLHSPRDLTGDVSAESTSGKLRCPPIKLPPKQDNRAQFSSPCKSMDNLSDLGVSSVCPFASPSPIQMQSSTDLRRILDGSISPRRAVQQDTCISINSNPSIESATKSLTPPDVIGAFNTMKAQHTQTMSKSASTSKCAPMTVLDATVASPPKTLPVFGTGGSASLPMGLPLSNRPSRQSSPRAPSRSPSGSLHSNPPLPSSIRPPGLISSSTTCKSTNGSVHLPPQSPRESSQGRSIAGFIGNSCRSLPAEAQKLLNGPGRNSSPSFRARQSAQTSVASSDLLKVCLARNDRLTSLDDMASSGSLSRSHSAAARKKRGVSLDGPSRYSSPCGSQRLLPGSQQNSPRKLLDPMIRVDSSSALSLGGPMLQSSPCSPQQMLTGTSTPPTLPMQRIPSNERIQVEPATAPVSQLSSVVTRRWNNQSNHPASSLGTGGCLTRQNSLCPAPTVPLTNPFGSPVIDFDMAEPSRQSDMVYGKGSVGKAQEWRSGLWPSKKSDADQRCAMQACIPTTDLSNTTMDGSTTTLLSEGMQQPPQGYPIMSDPMHTKTIMLMATTALTPPEFPLSSTNIARPSQESTTATLAQSDSTLTLLSPAQILSPVSVPRDESPTGASLQHLPSSSSTTPSFSPKNAIRKGSSSRSPVARCCRSPSRSPVTSPRVSRNSTPTRQHCTPSALGARDLAVTIDGIYIPDPKDWLDTLLSWSHKSLNSDIRQQLSIQRVGNGDYIIDGRRVSLRWGSLKGGSAAGLLVQEKRVEGDEEMPLHIYLTQKANVVARTSPRAPFTNNSSRAQQMTLGDCKSGASPQVSDLTRRPSVEAPCIQVNQSAPASLAAPV